MRKDSLLYWCIVLLMSVGTQLFAQQAGSANTFSVAVPDHLDGIENLVYARYRKVKLYLDLYRPRNTETLPTIVLVHGGGWAGGDKARMQGMAVLLAKKGFVVLNINYRLSSVEQFPGSVQDVNAAIRWARANAKRYRIDANNIFGVGGSAGGHLVAMAGLSDGRTLEGNGGKKRCSSRLKAIVVMGSGMDQYTRILNAPNQYNKNCEAYLGSFAAHKQNYIDASPIRYISESDPAVYMIDGERDRPYERYKDFVIKLDSVGVENGFKVIPKAKHGQWNVEPFRTLYVDQISEFLCRHLQLVH